MTDASEQLRTASDQLLRDLETLGELEEEKRTLSPDEPRMLELAAQIRELAARVLGDSKAQEILAQVVSAHSEIEPAPAIEETPRSIPAVLAAWREAERQLADALPESPEAEVARRRVEQLRAEYRRASRERGERN